jgi:hypothetical protein
MRFRGTFRVSGEEATIILSVLAPFSSASDQQLLGLFSESPAAKEKDDTGDRIDRTSRMQIHWIYGSFIEIL